MILWNISNDFRNLPNPRTKQTFYDQGDFGYLKERQLLSDICTSKEEVIKFR